MIKKYKNYIIFAVIIAVLIGAYILISSLESKPTDIPETGDASVTLFSAEPETISSVSINNESGEYTFLFGDSITVKGKEYIDIDTEKAENLKSEISVINAQIKVKENADNLSDYGLDNPKNSAVISDTSGKSVSIYLGDKSPAGNGYYMKKNSENNVYIISEYVSSIILRKLDYYRNTVLLNIIPNNITDISYEKKGGSKISFKKNTFSSEDEKSNHFYAFRMTEPYDWDVEETEISKVVNSLKEFQIIDYISDNPQDISKYGFNPYYAKINLVQSEGENYELLLGNNIDGKYYVMLKGNPAVYTVASEGFSYIDMEPNAYLQTFAYIKHIDTIKKIVYNHNEAVKAEFEIKKVREEEYDVKKEGKNVSQLAFKSLFTELVSLTIGGNLSYTPQKAPILTYEFYFNDGSKDTVCYYEYDERKIALSVNGKIQFYVNKPEFEARINTVDNIINTKF